ncbi:hypothetical protein SAMN02745823_02988 [Sporobacter termitidis DSM 10068]|uniref:Phosphatidylglycerol lysyltransferase n=1 Tax=Sporobacter termitidis DSM 10068 TaxID=1123282 RepID=A0A1M5YY55_9FIRM|nr:lysylphosphatidylglycerol synthase transmembrane domain-containing protein [Sporobacter termitidis]SHI16915.1 hypothetical protein SAMN02745823_02988 [Sporobacter termitidis DSM 10068]
MSRKMKLQLILGVLITAVVIYFSYVVVKSLNINVIFRSDINWWLVIVSVGIYMYSNYVRGLAYSKGITPDMDDMTALEVIGIGHALNMVLPLHAGEGIRLAFFPAGYSVLRRTKLAIISSLSDAVVVIIITALTVPFARFTDKTLLKAMWILLFVCVGGLLVATVLIILVERIRNYVKEFLNISLLKMLMWVALSWVILIAAFWLGLVAFGFSMTGSVQMALAVFVATNIVNLIPASPGAIGLFEYGTVVGLGGLGVEKSVALSASLLLHVIQYAALLPMGAALYIKAIHGKYGDAVKKARLKSGDGTPPAAANASNTTDTTHTGKED